MTHRKLIVLVLSALVAGCNNVKPDYWAQLPPGTVALYKIPPEMYPDFSVSSADLVGIRVAIQHSLDYMSKPSSGSYYPYADIDHARAIATLRALDQLASTAAASPVTGDWINQQIRQNFEVYQSVGAPAPDGHGYTGRVLFTGYFTPIYDASLTRGGAYQWPLYKRPADLISDPVTGDVKGRRQPDGSMVPYYTRAQIEAGALAGQELVWLTSRWEAYVVTVQGNGRLRLPDGRIYEVGYAGQNGYPYVSASEHMVTDGVISKEQVNLKTLGDYFAAHPEDMDKYLSSNPRTVFFAATHGGPYGSLNVPVTPMATIATDKEGRDIYPRAMPAFLTGSVPSTDGSGGMNNGFFLDQDTGGAIRAAGRCDIYMGVGQDAEELAGRELNDGQLYYIAVKPALESQYLQTGDK
jgi:membrane-bound lytic murein transglycosylase A